MRIPAGMTIEITVARTPVKFAGAPIAGAQTFGMATAPGLMGRVAGHLAEIAAEGTVVRAQSNSWYTANGTTVNLVVTSELTELREADVDTAKLTMPTGYKQGQ
jgi:hypothetical protein